MKPTDICTVIGEGPVWNEKRKRLYFVDSVRSRIYVYDPKCSDITVQAEITAYAIAFDKKDRMLISAQDGVFLLSDEGEKLPLYDRDKFKILHANDMKVGPDGRLYVGTQSEKRLGLSSAIDGKLYVIDPCGEVRVLLDGLLLSNGMDWSADGKKFYHTDSDTGFLREYLFDRETGGLTYTGRELSVRGIDGFTVGKNGKLFAACWGKGCIAVVDTASMMLEGSIKLPTSTPTSCAFLGENSDVLAVTSASYRVDLSLDHMAGQLFFYHVEALGRDSYRFGE